MAKQNKDIVKNIALKNKLSLEDFIKICSSDVRIELNPRQKEKIKQGRETLEGLLRKKTLMYGVNTGFGALAQEIIKREKIDELQLNLIRSHACGVGNPLPPKIVKGMILLLINSLSKGYSGIRPQTVEFLINMFNKGVIPVIPEKGSVGGSGDLVPLAHLALILIGEGEAYYNGKRQSAESALAKAGLRHIKLKAKEGLALLNGTHAMASVAIFCINKALNLLATADIASAMSLEALKGTDASLRNEIHRLKFHPGQLAVADNLRRLVKGSQIIASHKNCSKVQDVYSLRCISQVHGASRDAVSYAKGVIETEMNSVTDNPLIFKNREGACVLSGGNFHGQAIAFAMDFLGIAVSEIANISERRIEKLLNPQTNGLLPFLIKDSGINSGFMISQYAAASLVSQNKVLAHPASVDSIPTSANIEDHVSMGSIACHKAQEICENTENVLAIELLCAAQALDLHKPLKPGKGILVAHQAVRRIVPFIEKDAVLYKYIENIRSLMESELIKKEVENIIGEL